MRFYSTLFFYVGNEFDYTFKLDAVKVGRVSFLALSLHKELSKYINQVFCYDNLYGYIR